MTPVSKNQNPQIQNLERFRRFELLAHSVVEGLFTGLHKSPYKGYAVEFAEHREYSPGDDLRHVDWKVYAKLNRFYVKEYEEDTSLHAYLLLDASRSMAYGPASQTKFDIGRAICGVLSYVLMYQHDAVGLMTFDEKIRTHLPPRYGRSQTTQIMGTMRDEKTGSETDMSGVLHKLADTLRRRALVVIVSDFFDDPEKIARALDHFAHRKHEVLLFQVLDKRETDFNFSDMTRFECLESGISALVDPVRIRREYLRRFQEHQQILKRACRKHRIHLIRFFTDDAFEPTMARYLAGRPKR